MSQPFEQKNAWVNSAAMAMWKDINCNRRSASAMLMISGSIQINWGVFFAPREEAPLWSPKFLSKLELIGILKNLPSQSNKNSWSKMHHWREREQILSKFIKSQQLLKAWLPNWRNLRQIEPEFHLSFLTTKFFNAINLRRISGNGIWFAGTSFKFFELKETV